MGRETGKGKKVTIIMMIITCGHLIVDQVENEEDKLIIRMGIRKRIRTKDKQTLWWIRKYINFGMDANFWKRKQRKLRGKETLMTAEDNITRYNFERICLL